jgi:tetratricopeptide (TPR) repeat protein
VSANPSRPKPGRNDPCHCGSGRKYKHCHADADAKAGAPQKDPAASAALARAAQARAAGRTGEALAVLERAIAAAPHHGGLNLELGRLLLAAGRPQQALPLLEHAVTQQPALADARLQQGQALEQLGWHAQATEAYHQAVALAPRQAEGHARLGIVLLVQDRRAEAAAAFRRAAALAPQTSIGRLAAAYAFLADGAADEAVTALQRVLAVEPQNAPAQVELGKLLAERGDAAGAEAAFTRALALNPRAAGHYLDRVRIRRIGEADRPLLVQMDEAARRTDLPQLHRAMLEVARGKARDDLGEPGVAMDHYRASGELKAQMRPLDRPFVSARADWQIRHFTPDLWKRSEPHRSASAQPLLVLGMPRSGTTLVESILACHPDVAAGEELPFWNQRGREWLALDALPEGDALARVAHDYLSVLAAIGTAPRVTDKKPDNFVWAGLVHWVFPGARIVHCRRHPLDTCTSILGNFFSPRPDFSTRAEDLVFYWRQYERLMAHWRAVLPPERFLEIDYELLAAEPEPQIRRLLEFCGLAWDPACLAPERSMRRVSTASLWQVRQPISRASVGRWRRYATCLGPLRELLRPGEGD